MSNFDERWYEHTDSDGNKYYDHNAPVDPGCLSMLGAILFIAGGIGSFLCIFGLIFFDSRDKPSIGELLGVLAMLIVGFIIFRFGTKHHI